ncbi:hypothetical protein DFH28DRAFT_1084475 [Melampsora americana]|nr:hypothetical protein DFH28DRAFT_1084475 [Melampsora americana]
MLSINQLKPISISQSSYNLKPISISQNPKLISALTQQAITNADSTYNSLPPVTSGFDQIKLTNPSTLLKLRLHISSLPKIGLKITRPAKEMKSYGLNFGVLPCQSASENTPHELSRAGLEDQLSLVDQTLLKHSNQTPSSIKAKDFNPIQPSSKTEFDLMNQYQMTVDEAALQLKFSHKAVVSKVLSLILEAGDQAVRRGMKPEKLIVSQAWVIKGFHTTELQVRARGRYGQITHPTAKLCVILKESEPKSQLNQKALYKAAQKQVKQKGIIPGASWRLPADGIVPTSMGYQSTWAW